MFLLDTRAIHISNRHGTSSLHSRATNHEQGGTRPLQRTRLKSTDGYTGHSKGSPLCLNILMAQLWWGFKRLQRPTKLSTVVKLRRRRGNVIFPRLRVKVDKLYKSYLLLGLSSVICQERPFFPSHRLRKVSLFLVFTEISMRHSPLLLPFRVWIR